MPNRKKTKLTPEQELILFYKANIHPTHQLKQHNHSIDDILLLPLQDRIAFLLNILKKSYPKFKNMYLIMYDIEKDKVRNQIAKYLIKKGCIRIQKSIYIISTNYNTINLIKENLKYIQSLYDNNDSIIIMPISKDILTKSEIIGKEIYLDFLSNPNSTLFL